MNVNVCLASLVQYALNRGLIEPCDKTYAMNQLLQVMQLDGWEPESPALLPLEDILQGLIDNAVSRSVCQDDVTSRDLFDTQLMGVLTPAPREVRNRFSAHYVESPEAATGWYYKFCQDTDYIRRYRVQKDIRWKTATEYGNLDISINLSKPEKDPRDIAAAKAAPQSGYPMCQLCVENEGYAGNRQHPARQNHRIIPVSIHAEDWFLQYSPYVYYNEHCIVFNAKHTPMKINKAAFDKLLDFVTLFPHYFIGSNADLPIVGGSILSHEHFQGGRYTFAMEKASVEQELVFRGYEHIKAGIVKWPMSVIRLTGADKEAVSSLAEKIRSAWSGYTDKDAFIFAQTMGNPHNTITPIARRREDFYELDLVLRNNITTAEHPLGVYHPHAELHHIKKENIGLIEVMGLAVLPARLKEELSQIEAAILARQPLTGDLAKHAPWVAEIQDSYTLTKENISSVLKMEVGKVFAQVLEHAGVFKRTVEGQAAFRRFIDYINQEG